MNKIDYDFISDLQVKHYQLKKTKICIVARGRIVGKYFESLRMTEDVKLLSNFFKEIHVIMLHPDSSFKYKLKNNVIIHTNRVLFPENIVLSTILSIISSFITLLKIHLEKKIDLIYTQEPVLTGSISILISKIFRVPVIVKCGGNVSEITYHTLKDKNYKQYTIKLITFIIKFTQYFVFSLANGVIAVSPDTYLLARRYGAKNVTILGVTLNDYLFHTFETKKLPYLSPNKFTFLTTGRLVSEKGLTYLIKAAQKFKNTNIQFVIVGDGAQMDVLQKLTKSLGLEDFVFFTGRISYKKMPQIYNMADAYISPSLTEGMSVSILEAMACGKPVIATSVGAVPLIFKNEENILMIPSRDIKELTNKIVNMYEDPKLRLKLSKNARTYVIQKFGIKKFIEKELIFFDKIVENI